MERMRMEKMELGEDGECKMENGEEGGRVEL